MLQRDHQLPVLDVVRRDVERNTKLQMLDNYERTEQVQKYTGLALMQAGI